MAGLKLPHTRKIGGRRYYRVAHNFTKGEAQKKASYIRRTSRGSLVRVIPEGGKFSVFST